MAEQPETPDAVDGVTSAEPPPSDAGEPPDEASPEPTTEPTATDAGDTPDDASPEPTAEPTATDAGDAPDEASPDFAAAPAPTDAPEDAETDGYRRRVLLSLPASWVALVFVCLSFTPSLLPRGAIMQGILSGLLGAIGYGLGLAGAWVWRELAERPERRAKAGRWRMFGIVAVVAALVSFLLGLRWQLDVRDEMGIPAEGLTSQLLVPVVTVAVFLLFVFAARGIRWIFRMLARLFGRWMGRRVAHALGWILAAVIAVLLLNGVLIDGALNALDAAFASRDKETTETAVEPVVSTRSGGPGSLVAWDSLGRQGRNFVGMGPTAAEIGEFTGQPAPEPIRAYAGLDSEEDVEQRARLAVDELLRTGGFERAYLLVCGTTGTGWVDPSAIEAFEYETGGDSAAVAMQYSYLPSWLSFLVDRERAREAGRALFDAVYEQWSALPIDDRPQLIVFGLSLGTFAAETAFSGEFDMSNRTDGILFAGAPGFNFLHTEFTEGRDPESLEIEPVYHDGRIVRFSGDRGAPTEPETAPWDGTRVLYLQHATDPIVWWGSDLLWSRPDWLEEPRGNGVSDAFIWLPIVTFWQVTADMAEVVEVPDAYGHTYTSAYVDAWAEVLQPEGWTEEKAAELQAIVQASAAALE